MDQQTTILVVSGDGAAKIELNMNCIYEAENRVHELSVINSHKAPELISCFLRGFAALSDHIARISEQLVKAENILAKRKAVIVIDVAPSFFKERGLRGTEDQRESLLEMDEEWTKARDVVQQLEAWRELLCNKSKSIEMAYLAARKVIGDSYHQSQNTGFSANRDVPFQRSEWNAAKEFEDGETVTSVAVIPVVAKNVTTQYTPPVPAETSARASLRAGFGNVKD